MLLPVACFNACVLDGVAAMDHHPVSDINTDMGSAGCVIRPLEENEVSRFGVGFRHGGTDTAKPLRAEPAEVPSDAAVVTDVADET